MFDAYCSSPAADAIADEVSAPMIYRAIREHLSCDLGGEAVILNLKTGKYYGLNSIGARIWELLQSPVSTSSIEAFILDEFDVEPDECRSEVGSFIEDLKSESLIEYVEGVVEIPGSIESRENTAS